VTGEESVVTDEEALEAAAADQISFENVRQSQQ
jgi:hypothetical protein